MYVTSSDTNIHAAAAGDRNGSVAKVLPTVREVVARDVPPRPAASAAHANVSLSVVSQRFDIIDFHVEFLL